MIERRQQDVESAMLRRDVEELTAKVEKLSKDVESLLAAWNTSMHVVVFVKWIASLATAMGVIWALAKGFGK
jgi:hypothetical protein